MSAKSVNQAIVQRRLEEMRELLDYLESRSEVKADELRENIELRLAVERALTRVVELASNINAHVVSVSGRVPPADYYSTFIDAGAVGLVPPELAERLAPSAGLRNVLVHEYASIDLGRVADSVAACVTDFGEYVRRVAEYLQG